VRNQSDTLFQGAVLAFGYSEVRFYTFSDNILVSSAKTGFFHQKKSAELSYDGYFDTLKIAPGNEVEIYAAIRHSTRFALQSGIDIYIGDIAYFERSSERLQTDNRPFGYFSFVFLGLLLFQLIYISFQWYLVQRIEYMYYILYILALTAYFGGRYLMLYSEFDWSSDYLARILDRQNDILLILPTFFYYRFGRYFLNLKQTLPDVNTTIKRIEYVILAQAIFIALTNSFTANDFNKTALVLTCIGMQFVLTLIVLRKIYTIGTSLSRFILIGSIVAITTHLIAMLFPFLGFNPSILIQPGLITMSGIILEIAIFNSGLLFKAREGERQKLEAQQALLDELTRRQKIQEAYAGVRDRIASDLHDDVGSSLSSISIYSYAAKVKLGQGNNTAATELLDMIERNAADTMNAMSDLVWAINPLNDSADKLLLRIKSFCSPLLAAKEISCTWQVDEKYKDILFTQLERRNILLVFKELINNLVKHSEATSCSCLIKVTDRKLHLEISDNGKGFDQSITSEGNGLRTLKQRVVELGGELKVDSASGTHYYITIPLSI
jgi:signal transduction histidine kinase